MNSQNSRVVIVGAGMAGLTAAAYLSKAGMDVLLLEKNNECGGLLTSFERDGFLFDAGARSIENSGIVRPMLRDLGIELDLIDSPVSIGIENEIINFDSLDRLEDYRKLLEKLYPESLKDISKIFVYIKKILKDMGVLYGIDNPYFRDLKHDKQFIFKELLPWVGKFFFTLRRISRLNEPVESFLHKLSSNRSLIDIIDQHFFKKTPTFFALGYYYVYLDYFYPKGGTGELPNSIRKKILEWGGKIKFDTQISKIIPSEQKILDVLGNSYEYDNLIWCADLKTLYQIINPQNLDASISENIAAHNEKYLSHRGGDSIFSFMIGVDEIPAKFASISNGHFFYTPSKQGLNELFRSKLQSILTNFENVSKEELLQWLDEYCQLNTYEISIPALRDASLAPEGKTGIIFSFLFEYDLIKKVHEAGWYDEFKIEVENRILDTLGEQLYPGIKDKILFQFSSTPLDISRIVGSSEGGITGWSFETPVPVVNDLKKMVNSVNTPIPNVLKAGQWAYSPSGIPIAILTGWHAAQSILKKKK
ncbi:Thiamine thiazole synthase [Candidatus Lokiarchaeum ossiferum]|uniref:Thiamine thiazole synthase n=1 Tax=Candidatus Lokiarchaeum ossiferum TaxID=2951803 RepID=A0ABY6HKP3_9ARCH|nr:Thiamine thiazole synthase [Candidatus Lokiarchaeum sp. B-35]